MAVKNLSLLAAIALSGCAVFAPIEDMVMLDEQTQESGLSQHVDDASALASSVRFQKQFKED